MIRKPKPRAFDEVLSGLRSLQFDVRDVPAVANQVWIEKYGCAIVLARPAKGPGVAMVVRPGCVVGGEIGHILDRGYQKFLKTSRLEVPATADHLRSLHRFAEEVKEITNSVSLYNESLGTVSDEYMYDRVKGRDVPVAKRPPAPWELPAETR